MKPELDFIFGLSVGILLTAWCLSAYMPANNETVTLPLVCKYTDTPHGHPHE